MDTLGIVAGASVLAFVIEALLEYVAGIYWKPLEGEARKRVLMAAGLVLGIAACLIYRLDVLSTLGLPPSILGQFATGALIGRGAEYWHAIYKKLKPA